MGSKEATVSVINDHPYEEFFATSSDLMVVLDLAGRVAQANPAFLNLVKRTTYEVAGQSLALFVHRADQSRLVAALERLAGGSLAERVELRCLLQAKDMARCDFTLTLSNQGPYVLVLGRNLDDWYQHCNAICKEHQALERLIDEQTRELQLANAEMESFSFSISHDLRAPLRAIRGFAMAIAEEQMDVLGVTGRDYLRRILANCERMTTLTDYLLQLARMSRQELRRTTVDLGAIADTLMADLQAVEPARDVTYMRQGPMMVLGDRELLFTLLQNLLDNAWKYTAKRPKANIVFFSEEVDGETIFSVADNGVGYPLALQERLFMLFQRLHDPSEYEGLGIGLPAAQCIVQRHGGRIWSECIEGVMTVFHFTLNHKG